MLAFVTYWHGDDPPFLAKAVDAAASALVVAEELYEDAGLGAEAPTPGKRSTPAPPPLQEGQQWHGGPTPILYRLRPSFNWDSVERCGPPTLRLQGLGQIIKDDLLHFPRFRSLAELRNFVLECDSRYWERKEYDSMINGRSSQPARAANHSSSNATNNNQSSSGSNNNKNHNKTNNSGKGSNNNSSNNKSQPDISSKLGKDGKLLPEERQRRVDQGLCLLCGTKGHIVKDCPKNKSTNGSGSKGQAAKTPNEGTSASITEVKK
ncbi:hypothetical protein JB92DRAFT_3104688 [Gautieria morchelliformis]|nr:hypothetical protein JB92DRAFT_3104688 [Gautieria morchelliformis]